MQITPQRFTRVLPAIILALAVYILFVSLDIGKYRTHHLPDRVAQVTGEQSYLSDVSLYVSPSDEKWLLEKIDHAQSHIFVGVYTFTLPSLREALSRAQERGVVVRIILEKHPYEAATTNRDTKKYLQQQGI